MDQPIPITGILLAALRPWALSATLLFAGCSIPVGVGGNHLTFGYARSSESLRQVQTVVPGLDLRLGTGHDGINLGWSSLVVAAPARTPMAAADGSKPTQPWRYAPPFGLRRLDDTGVCRVGWFFWQRRNTEIHGCHFIAAEHVGVALNLSGHSTELHLGAGQQTWLLAPVHGDGAWRLSFRSGLTGVTCLEEHDPIQIKPK